MSIRGGELSGGCIAPIGVFDSGVGGLSVFAHLASQLPHERYVYLADTKHVPYGSRSAEEIRQLTLQAVDWLVEQGCKLVVIACNTASAHGLQAVRARYPNLLIVGLVPALKPAVFASQTKQVAVLATPATLHGELLNTVITEVAHPHGVEVHKYSIASLVPWVELGMPSQHPAVSQLDALLDTLAGLGVDQLVLGCTHFPFFKPYLEQRWPAKSPPLMATTTQPMSRLHFVDSGEAIAKRVAALLEDANLRQPTITQTRLAFYSTAIEASTEQVASRLLTQLALPIRVDFFQLNIDH